MSAMLADVQIDSGEGEQPMEGFYSEILKQRRPRTAPDDDDVVLRYYNLLVFNFQTCEEFPFYIGIPTEIYNELICFLDIKRRLLFLSTIF